MNWLDQPGRTVAVAAGIIGLVVLLAVGLTLGLEMGEQDFSPGTPERAFQDFLEAFEDDDYAVAYSSLSARVREDVTEDEYIDEARRQVFYPSTEDQRVRIDRTSVEGDEATLHLLVEHSYGDGFGSDGYVDERMILMVREGGEWKIDMPLLGLVQAWNLTIPTPEITSPEVEESGSRSNGRS